MTPSHLVVIFVVALLFVEVADAFMPGRVRHTNDENRETMTHQDLTGHALMRVAADFMAADPIRFPDVNRTLDSPAFRRAAMDLMMSVPMPDLDQASYRPEDHFDSESFEAGLRRLVDYRRRVIEEVRARNMKNARQLLGEALHTVQDFYSHSNWVEMGRTETHPAVGPGMGPLSGLALIDDPTCINCHRVTDTSGVDYCRDNCISGELLTSGYVNASYSLSVMIFGATKPPGKCSHGGELDASSTIAPTGGINKDSVGSDHGYLHHQAAHLAAKASVEYINSLRRNLTVMHFSDLIGVTSPNTVCFVMAMSDNVAQAAQALISVMQQFNSTPRPHIDYVIPMFDYTRMEPMLLQTSNVSVVIGALRAVSSMVNPDMSVMPMHSLDHAISALVPGSSCFVFVDRPAQDDMLCPFVLAHALDNSITINVINVTNTDGSDGSILRRRRRSANTAPPMSDYETLAQLTGGTFTQVSVGDELVAAAFSTIDRTFRESQVTVFNADNVVNEFMFNIDSTLDSVTISISDKSATLETVTFTSPSDTGTEFTGYTLTVDFLGVRTYDMGKLDVGQWTVTLVNDGSSVSVKVTASSVVSVCAKFAVSIDGIHPGYQAVVANPIVGVPDYRLLVEVMGAFCPMTMQPTGAIHNVTSVLLVSESGATLATLPAFELMPLMQYVAYPPALTGGFRVVIEGLDADSNVFQRYTDSFIMPSTVSLEVRVQGDGVLGTQSDVTVSVNVTNHGPATTYYLQITDTLAFYVGNSTLRIDIGMDDWTVVELQFSSSGGDDSADDSDSSSDSSSENDGEGEGDGDGGDMPAGGGAMMPMPGFGGTTMVTITVGDCTVISMYNYRVLALTLGPRIDGADCKVNNVKGKCLDRATGCSSGTWTAHFHIRDKYVGLQSISAVTPDPSFRLNVGDFKNGTRSNVNAFYTGTCCYRTAKIMALNARGGLAMCNLKAKKTKKEKHVMTYPQCQGKNGWKRTQCLFKATKKAEGKGKKGKHGNRGNHGNRGGNKHGNNGNHGRKMRLI